MNDRVSCGSLAQHYSMWSLFTSLISFMLLMLSSSYNSCDISTFLNQTTMPSTSGSSLRPVEGEACTVVLVPLS
jgi:hypothetical protein